MEAFGQSEALTTRLRHIIQAYADGPGILMELIQNADDAGATTVAFMLDCTSYPTGSLLGGAGWHRVTFEPLVGWCRQQESRWRVLWRAWACLLDLPWWMA